VIGLPDSFKALAYDLGLMSKAMRIRRSSWRFAILTSSINLAAALGGCATSGAGVQVAGANAKADLPKAECLVCKYNADLACVGLRVDDSTPRFVYQGVTYYFCSPECQAAFGKDPVKYLRR